VKHIGSPSEELQWQCTVDAGVHADALIHRSTLCARVAAE
jgi:hypothetical protein